MGCAVSGPAGEGVPSIALALPLAAATAAGYERLAFRTVIDC